MLLKKTYIYYIYNIIKRNTQGLVVILYSLSGVVENTETTPGKEYNYRAGIRQE